MFGVFGGREVREEVVEEVEAGVVADCEESV